MSSIGYLGFKNARFGKIDSHITICAFSREILKKAVAIAESRGFKLVHGIVDSMWLKKPNATEEEYQRVCERTEEKLEDGTLKVRGIDLRRHDTPEIVRKCQADLLPILSHAHNSDEFRAQKKPHEALKV